MGDEADRIIDAMLMHSLDPDSWLTRQARRARKRQEHMMSHDYDGHDIAITTEDKPKEGKGMNNTSLYAPIYDQSVMMHDCAFHDTDGEENTRRYTYKSAIHVQEGDTVLCEARGWYQLCTVVKCDVSIPIETDTKYKWIVAKIDLHSHDTLKEWEQGLIEEVARKRVDNIRQQLIASLGVNPNELTTLMAPVEDADIVDKED